MRIELGRLRESSHYRRMKRLLLPAWMWVGRTKPLSDWWGFDRGTPVDRHYIEQFLHEHRADIRGRVLEVKDSAYTRRFGQNVEAAEVLDIDPANPAATVVADLAQAGAVPADSFDCFILTQTLQLIYDTRAALRHACRMLRPSGVLLVTVPCVSRILQGDGLKTDYWRFTAASCAALFAEVFGPAHVTVRPCGNVHACMAFLTGMATEELSRRKLEKNDPYFPLIITVRAVKP